MANPFHIITHWADNNPLMKQALSNAVQQDIAVRRQTKRYRRLIYYFFEKEIVTDTTKRLSSQYHTTTNTIGNPEIQALVQRSAMKSISSNQELVFWHESTRIVNDYLFGQSEFAYDNIDSDSLVLKLLGDLLNDGYLPQTYTISAVWVSDVCAVLPCRRHDIQIINLLLTGQCTYRSLLQLCGDHIAEFGVLPMLFDYLPELSWSSDSLLQLLDSSIQEKLLPLLSPQYEIVCQYITLLPPYGQQDVLVFPYATWFSRFGYRWSQQSWWIKILVSISVVFVSSLFGVWSLLLMPLIWGFLQGAGVVSDYVCIMQQILQDWYRSYTTQNSRYLSLYETMIDPECSTRQTMHAQQLMTRRYDVLSCGGHELIRDVQLFSQQCIYYLSQIINTHSISDEFLKDLAQMQAIQRRGEDNCYSLWVVKQENFHEQYYLRFLTLFNLSLRVVGYHHLSGYEEQYDAISELMNNKVSQFHRWTSLCGIKNGLIVACSSGVLGWLGAYLWNRSTWGQKVFAASGNLVQGVDTLSFVDDKLLPGLSSHLSQSDIVLLTHSLQQDKTSTTLWELLVKLFGHKVGNTTNTLMMDNRRRALDEQGRSELFTKAFDRGMPLNSHSSGWGDLMSFLDRIYAYDNFAKQQLLVHGDWLSETLTSLHDGTMTIDQFAHLPKEQREIVTQSLFTMIHQEDIAGLLLDSPVLTTNHMSSVLLGGQSTPSPLTFPVVRTKKKSSL